jgi:hypothetical protein
MEHQFPLLFPGRGKPTSVGGVVDFERKRTTSSSSDDEATPPNQKAGNWLGGEICAAYNFGSKIQNYRK